MGCHQLPVGRPCRSQTSRPATRRGAQREPRFARTFAVFRVFVAAIVPAVGKVPRSILDGEGRRRAPARSSIKAMSLRPQRRDAQTPARVPVRRLDQRRLGRNGVGSGWSLSPSEPRSEHARPVHVHPYLNCRRWPRLGGPSAPPWHDSCRWRGKTADSRGLGAVLRVVPRRCAELTRREILLLLRREFGVGMQSQLEPCIPKPPQPRHGFDAAPGTDEYTARAVRPRSMRRGGCLLALLWRELSLLASVLQR